ncbi:hypothetical protein LguiA_006508 [Lonicera macranthoides]
MCRGIYTIHKQLQDERFLLTFRRETSTQVVLQMPHTIAMIGVWKNFSYRLHQTPMPV